MRSSRKITLSKKRYIIFSFKEGISTLLMSSIKWAGFSAIQIFSIEIYLNKAEKRKNKLLLLFIMIVKEPKVLHLKINQDPNYSQEKDFFPQKNCSKVEPTHQKRWKWIFRTNNSSLRQVWKLSKTSHRVK